LGAPSDIVTYERESWRQDDWINATSRYNELDGFTITDSEGNVIA